MTRAFRFLLPVLATIVLANPSGLAQMTTGDQAPIKSLMLVGPPASCTDACSKATDDVAKDCCACYCQSDGTFDSASMGKCMAEKGVGHCDAQPAPGSAPPPAGPSNGLAAARVPPGPSYPCSSLARVDPNHFYRCGDYLVYLKAAMPDDVKTMPAHQAMAELQARDLIIRFVKSELGDFVLVSAPNDPRFGEQGGLNGASAADIGAIDAWSALTGSSTVIVAMIDSGANIGHEDLQANIWTNPDETPGNGADEDGNTFVDDVHGFDFVAGVGDVTDPVSHGTGIAGIIGAVGNNGVGIAGINWNVRLLPLKFTDNTGKGSLSTAVTAIDYAIAKGAKVINASFVMDLSAGDPAKVQILKDAVQKAVEAGIVFVAAAGNDFVAGGINIDSANVFPAALPIEPIIAVAAVDGSGNLADFSNFGPGAVDIAAPGVSILTTTAGGSYAGTKGTSIATPHVAGAAALLLSHNALMTPAQVKAVIVDNARALPGLSGKVASGGLLDLKAALISVGALSASASPTAPAQASGDTAAAAEKTSTAPSGKSGGGCALSRD